jgi:hypothetical protein
VSDGVERAVCIFIDFFDSHELNKIEPQDICNLINSAFLSFDQVLAKWPLFEKIKVTSL